MEKQLYFLSSRYYLELVTTYGSEIEVESLDPTYMFLKLTEGQLEELNAVEIFPSPV